MKGDAPEKLKDDTGLYLHFITNDDGIKDTDNNSYPDYDYEDFNGNDAI